MLTWLTKSYANFNLSGPSLPLLGKIKQVILFGHLNSIVQYWLKKKEQANAQLFERAISCVHEAILLLEHMCLQETRCLREASTVQVPAVQVCGDLPLERRGFQVSTPITKS